MKFEGLVTIGFVEGFWKILKIAKVTGAQRLDFRSFL
jgi:hypothetical protein